ncbi:MAG: hypothetical protein EBV03_00565 [Proteobacteria bacterium]|nr:hypothetical protein [Pseudomonadota bacterium]
MEPKKDNTQEMDKAPAKNEQELDMTMKGRFNRYNSPFLNLMLPVLTTRYVWLALEDINPLNFLNPDPATPGFTPCKKPGFAGYLRRNFAALGMGATTLSIISYYSKRTYDDMHALYAEAVGYELDKKPQDVTWNDMFVKSQNSALAVTRDAFLKRTGVRLAVGASFLVPWHAFRDWKNGPPKYDANANAGVGAIGTYLSTDGFMRKPSFFDMEQNMVAKAINHADDGTHENIGTKNIQLLLMLQRRHLNKDYKWPAFSTKEGKQQATLATRIADLLNQTYDNSDKTESANLTIGKFNFLVGFGMLDSFPEALAFVELANKSKDMQEVKEANALIKSGQDARTVFAQFGVDMDALVHKHTSMHVDTAHHVMEHAATEKKFADSVTSVKEKLPQTSRSHQDFASIVDPLGHQI